MAFPFRVEGYHHVSALSIGWSTERHPGGWGSFAPTLSGSHLKATHPFRKWRRGLPMSDQTPTPLPARIEGGRDDLNPVLVWAVTQCRFA
jgi:hypothetical protein